MKNIANTKIYRVIYYLVCTLAFVSFVLLLGTTDIAAGGIGDFVKIVIFAIILVLLAVGIRFINEIISSAIASYICFSSYMWDRYEIAGIHGWNKECYSIYKVHNSYKSCYLECKHACSSLIYEEI